MFPCVCLCVGNMISIKKTILNTNGNGHSFVWSYPYNSTYNYFILERTVRKHCVWKAMGFSTPESILCKGLTIAVWFYGYITISIHTVCDLRPLLNRHQTILQTFLNFFLNLTLPGVSHLYKQLPNRQYLSDLCKMCNLDANLWKSWIGDHRILTYIFKWERLNTAGHSHSVSIGHCVAPLHND